MASITGRDQGGVKFENISGSINIKNTGDITGGSKIIIAERIEHSFNRVSAADVPENLKSLLDSLTRSVQAVIPELPEEKAQEAAGDLKALVDEATKPQPRKEWCQLSAKGLIEAAKTVGEMGKPIVETVGHILNLLV